LADTLENTPMFQNTKTKSQSLAAIDWSNVQLKHPYQFGLEQFNTKQSYSAAKVICEFSSINICTGGSK
jgi:uncharacterized protein YycO